MNEIALNKFYERLEAKAKGHKWQIVNGRFIRCGISCPLEIATDTNWWSRAATALQMDLRTANMVVAAADTQPTGPKTKAIRARLLSILGLSEVEA